MHNLCIDLSVIGLKKKKKKKVKKKNQEEGKAWKTKQELRWDNRFHVSSWNLFPIALLLSLVQLCLSFSYQSITLTPLQPQ